MTLRNSFRRFVFVAALAAIFVRPTHAHGADELLEEVRAGNQAALDSIQTLYCRVTTSYPVTPMGRVIPEKTAEYWWTAGSFRLRTKMESGFTESVRLADGTGRALAKGRDQQGREFVQFSMRRSDPDKRTNAFDPWSLGLLKLPGPNVTSLTLDRLLKVPHKLGEVKRETVDGRELICVGMQIDLSADSVGHFTHCFDPERNYLACQVNAAFSGSSADVNRNRRETKVLSMRKVAPNIYFPEHVESQSHEEDKLVSHEIAKITDIRVNQPLPPDIFELPIPPGAHVLDYIEDKEYKLDAQGKQVGPTRVPAKGPPPQATQKRATATTDEPKPLSRWIAPASLAILGVAGVLWFVRRWRMTRVA